MLQEQELSKTQENRATKRMQRVLQRMRDPFEPSKFADLSWVDGALSSGAATVEPMQAVLLYRCLGIGPQASYAEVEHAFFSTGNALFAGLRAAEATNGAEAAELQEALARLERAFFILRLPTMREALSNLLSGHKELISTHIEPLLDTAPTSVDGKLSRNAHPESAAVGEVFTKLYEKSKQVAASEKNKES